MRSESSLNDLEDEAQRWVDKANASRSGVEWERNMKTAQLYQNAAIIRALQIIMDKIDRIDREHRERDLAA